MSDSKSNGAEWLTTRTFLLLLAAALLAAFPEVALGFKTFFYRDFGALGYPGAIFTRDSLLRGQLPLWNPYSHCGVPWLAQMGQWYPPSLLSLFFPLPWAQNFLMLAHLWFGGFGMFWLLRRQNVGNFAAALAAFAFVFNGVSLSCLQWGNYIASLAWLPWVIGCVMEAWRSGGRWLPLAAGASAMQVLTATPEITMLTWIFLGAVWFTEIACLGKNFSISAARTFFVVLLAAGITMIQMLPFFDLLAHSQRDANTNHGAVWSMPGWGWANLIVPLFHCYPSPEGTWFQSGQDFLQSYYLGAGVLALAIVGAVFTKNRIAIVITAATLFCWIVTLGPNGFFYSEIQKIFPLVGIARFPVKFTILTAFLIPWLAAFGTEKNFHDKKSPRHLAIVGTLILISMIILLWFAKIFPFRLDNWNATFWNTIGRAGLMLLLLAGVVLIPRLKNRMAQIGIQLAVLSLISLDAFTHSPKLTPTLPGSVLAPGMWQATGKPAPPLGYGRVMIHPDAERQLLYSTVTDISTDFIGKRLAEWYNLNLLDGIPKVNGAVTLRPAHFDKLESYLYYTVGGHCGRGLADFLGVEWLSSPTNPTQWQKQTGFLPLITAGQAPVFASDEETLKNITSLDFNPRNVVYLPETARAFTTVSNQTTCVVTNCNFTLNKITADVQAATPGIVVISQSYYHLWSASVDDQPAPLLRANLAFQAVEVPAGFHHLKLIYCDPYLIIGSIISAVSLMICGFLFVLHRQRSDKD